MKYVPSMNPETALLSFSVSQSLVQSRIDLCQASYRYFAAQLETSVIFLQEWQSVDPSA